MLKTYSVNGIILTTETEDQMTGQKIERMQQISKEELDSLKVHIRIDITPKGAYDKFAQEQSLENLLVQQIITFEEYVDALDDDSTMPKLKLSKILEKRKEKQRQIQQIQMQANAIQGAMEEAMIMQEEQGNQIQQIANQAQGINDNAMAMMGGGAYEMQAM